MRVLFFGAVDDLSGAGEPDDAGKAERAAGHVLGEALDAGAVAGFESDAAIDAEAGVAPGSDLGDDVGGDSLGVQEQAEDIVFPESQERLVSEVLWKGQKVAVGCEGAVGHESVDVGVVMDELPEGLDGEDASGGDRCDVVTEQGAIGFEDGLPGEVGQLVEQVAVEAEEDAQTLGDGPDELTMWYVQAEVFGYVEAEQ